MKILLVDHDKTLVDLLSKALVERGYAFDAATDGEKGWIYGSTYTYDLIILEWFLPQIDGIGLCQRFRAHGYDTPIILLASRHDSHNKIRGLDAGADDYIYKPFDLDELLARVRTLLRRLNCGFFSVLSWGDLHLNSDSCQVSYQKQSLSLSTTEYSLLELFLRHQGEVLTIEDIIENLWSSSEYPAEATVRSHLRRLRQKLHQAGLAEDPITTVRGHGYCLKPYGQDTMPLNGSKQDQKQLTPMPTIVSSWKKYRHNSQQQLALLEQALQSLQKSKFELSIHRLWAIVTAHSLARNLKLLGFRRASQLATKLEQLLHHQPIQTAEIWLQLLGELQAVHQQISKDKHSNHISPSDSSRLFLIVNNDPNSNQQWSQTALVQGIRTQILPTADAAKVWLQQQQAQDRPLPDAVILNIAFDQLTSAQDLRIIGEFNSLLPSTPVIVIGDRTSFGDRLQVAQAGSCFYFTPPINPNRIIAFCQQLLQRRQEKKVMIVDDDVKLLRKLPSLLQPWGFKLTTLDDPRQFWDVLQAVSPDLLVLDLKMPHISGTELFQALRTDCYWYKLPVLFLKDNANEAVSTQTDLRGAYGFINKPIVADQLANHILHFLE